MDSKIEEIEWDLRDLEETIHIVESNPTQFNKVDATELSNRKEFINSTRKTLNVNCVQKLFSYY